METYSPAPFKMGLSKSPEQTTRVPGHPQQLLDQSLIPEPEKYVEFWPLSGKQPYFDIIIKQVHVAKKRLIIPNKISKNLPNARVPARIFCRGKAWDMEYLGHYHQSSRMFENRTWGKFAKDNSLAVGDACVFELIEGDADSTRIQFKVQILKDDFPSELLEKAEGYTLDNPISLE